MEYSIDPFDLEIIDKIIEKDIMRQVQQREYSKRYFQRVKQTEHYRKRNNANQKRYYQANKELIKAKALARYHEKKLAELLAEAGNDCLDQ